MPDRPWGRPSDLALLWRQVRAQNKLLLRNPFSAFFSLAFPVMFLLLYYLVMGVRSFRSALRAPSVA